MSRAQDKLVLRIYLIWLFLVCAGLCSSCAEKEKYLTIDEELKVDQDDITLEGLLNSVQTTVLPLEYSFDYTWTYNADMHYENSEDEEARELAKEGYGQFGMISSWHVDTAANCRSAMYSYHGTAYETDITDKIGVYVDFENNKFYTSTNAMQDWEYIEVPKDIPRNYEQFYSLCVPELTSEMVNDLSMLITDDAYVVTGNMSGKDAQIFIKYVGDMSTKLFTDLLTTENKADLTLTFDKDYALLNQIDVKVDYSNDNAEKSLELIWDIDYFNKPTVSIPEEVKKKAVETELDTD